MKSAKEIIETFWRIQDGGDYTKVVELFAEDAVLVDPFFGTFEGKKAIGEFMKKMNKEMTSRETSFIAKEIDGGGEVAWAQWTAKTPNGSPLTLLLIVTGLFAVPLISKSDLTKMDLSF